MSIGQLYQGLGMLVARRAEPALTPRPGGLRIRNDRAEFPLLFLRQTGAPLMPEKPFAPNDRRIDQTALAHAAHSSAMQVEDEAAAVQATTGDDDCFDQIASGLYSLASMLVGEGADSMRLVEVAVTTGDAPGCDESAEAAASRKDGHRRLCAGALETLARRDAANLATPQGLEHAATCIGDDELDAAGVSSCELEQMLAGPDRDRLRNWLESLPTPMRTIFVLRAVAGFNTTETVDLLTAHGGTQAAGWNPDSVRELFRQGLCSLASQVLQAANG
jgi:hypothetical protein